MPRLNLILAAGVWLAAGAAHAESAASALPVSAPMLQAVQSDPRPALAERLVALSLNGMDKVLQTSIDLGFQNLNEDLPEEQARWLRRNTAPILQSHMRPMIAAMAAAYAEQFTEAELNAMIAFYDTPIGQSVARKQLEVGLGLEAEVQKFEVAFMTELMTKFCAQFDCEGEPSKQTATAKPNRH